MVGRAPRLKRCPCCRSTSVRFIEPTPGHWFVVCDDCDFRNRPDFPSKEEAAGHWNDRAPSRPKGRTA